jgi:hypothetical protein
MEGEEILSSSHCTCLGSNETEFPALLSDVFQIQELSIDLFNVIACTLSCRLLLKISKSLSNENLVISNFHVSLEVFFRSSQTLDSKKIE